MSAVGSPRVSCPACGEGIDLSPDIVNCPNCAFTVKRCEEGVFDLRDDPSFDTLLDVGSYDAHHAVEQQDHPLSGYYEDILRRHGCGSIAHVFEIGAGSGNLTSGLVGSDFFQNVYASDLSPEFMALLQNRVGGARSDLWCLLLDANTNPFEDDSFDCVLGHSILHHLGNFEHTLAECYRVTRRGGACVFGEPVLDSHAYTSLAASIVLALESRDKEIPAKRRRTLAFLAERARCKRSNLDSDRGALRDIEDKFVFPIEYMRALARQIGFNGFECVSPPVETTLGQATRSLIERTFAQQGESTEFLAAYDFVFDSLTDAVGGPLSLNSVTPFSYLAFYK